MSLFLRAVLASVAATLLDVATYHPSHELNPLIVALGGTTAIGLRALVLVAAIPVAVLVWHTRYRVMSGLVFGALVVAGCVGALSNLTAA